MKVVETLLNNFVEQTLGGKREGSENVQKFLEARIKDYEQRLSAAEDKLSAFKKQNVGLLSSQQGGYFAQLQNEVDAAKKAKAESVRRDQPPRRADAATAQRCGGIGGRQFGTGVRAHRASTGGSDTLSRIQETQAKLDELLLRFTDKHPDVIAAHETLAELKKRRATELESVRRGDATAVASSGAGNNPVYQSIQLELYKVGVEIAALRREAAQHENTERPDSDEQLENQFVGGQKPHRYGAL